MAVEPDGLRLSSADAEVMLGDRLFFDTRFAQYFYAHCNGDINAPLKEGDPLVDHVTAVDRDALVSPFRGQSMNCRQCHLGNDFIEEQPLAGRTYADFTRRSAIPVRNDGLTATPRNSPSMVDLGLPRSAPMLLHFDGEFSTPEDLTMASFTGRNFGWLPEEEPTAVAHIARVIREDEGVHPRQLIGRGGKGIPYRVAMLGTDPKLPPMLRIPAQYRIDVMKASDREILEALGRLMHAYMDSIRFGTHNTFRDSASPYDVFLAKNDLPSAAREGESDLEYGQRLLGRIGARKSFDWVVPLKDGSFKLHRQDFRFGEPELQGLKIFLTRGSRGHAAHAGNCVMCHAPPRFTDHRLHNNGAAQAEYDGVFGAGAFLALAVPDLDERNAHFEAYLPASPAHPRATSRFRSAPAIGKPGYADLGAWNVLGNPDMPKPQAALIQILCQDRPARDCSAGALLPAAVAFFKTPSVRDLGQSNPYMHSGALDTLEQVLRFYIANSELARAGRVRNASPQIADIHLAARDVAPLAAFLRSLNEDYH